MICLFALPIPMMSRCPRLPGQLGVSLMRKLISCPGCWMGEGRRNPVAGSTVPRSTRPLERGFFVVSGSRPTTSNMKVLYISIVKYVFSRNVGNCCLAQPTQTAAALMRFLGMYATMAPGAQLRVFDQTTEESSGRGHSAKCAKGAAYDRNYNVGHSQVQ